MAQNFELSCRACGATYRDHDYRVFCQVCGRDAFLYTRYQGPYVLKGEEAHFASYVDWVPVASLLGAPGPTMAAIPGGPLGAKLGLRNLWVLISGNVPVHGARFVTGTFKETEALGVLSRVVEQTKKTLIISSAGNAARAFLEYGARLGIPMIVVVPASAVPELMIKSGAGSGPKPLLLSIKDSVYMDAIRFVDAAVAEYPEKLVREGGAFNVGRRDAMAVPFLFAIRKMRRLPDWYFQAVGSATGAIAAWEASQRLVEHGMVAPHAMRCFLVQNEPFTPIADAWREGRRQVVSMAEDVARRKLSEVKASVLSNAQPPYAVRGGVYDVLSGSNGAMETVTNGEIDDAIARVRDTLGFSPCPAGGAAVAGLIRAKNAQRVHADAQILLHVTGAGFDEMTQENGYHKCDWAVEIERGNATAGFSAIGKYLEANAR